MVINNSIRLDLMAHYNNTPKFDHPISLTLFSLECKYHNEPNTGNTRFGTMINVPVFETFFCRQSPQNIGVDLMWAITSDSS